MTNAEKDKVADLMHTMLVQAYEKGYERGTQGVPIEQNKNGDCRLIALEQFVKL